jgi:serine/threonine protein kinase
MKQKTTPVGGNVIASGGYGCVFNPALKCANTNTYIDSSNHISKLMTIKHAKEEYDDIVKYAPIITKIPNYKNYFIIDDVYLCSPDTLEKQDLENFNDRCSALKRDNIDETNINKKLDKLVMLNIPYGGIDVEKYVNTLSYETPELFIKLNQSLVALLLNGIQTINDNHIYHCDIKDSNILVDTTSDNIHCRLIDWGLSTQYLIDPFNDYFPEVFSGRSFAFNNPFSIVLFNTFFIETYNTYLQKKNDTPITMFVSHYIKIWVKKKGKGHIRTIYKMIVMILDIEDSTEDEKNDTSFSIIVYYISAILKKYTVNNIFLLKKYFEVVFLKNLDVYGFIISYFPIFEFYYKKKLNYPLTQAFQTLFIRYLFNTDVSPISIPNLVQDLNKLNNYFIISSSKKNILLLHSKNNKTQKHKLNIKRFTLGTKQHKATQVRHMLGGKKLNKKSKKSKKSKRSKKK